MPILIGKFDPLRAGEVLRTSLRLGLTAFGGPIAHLGHFERVFVRERRWLTGEQFGGLVALCHLLPGPTSSQVGFLIGWQRGGVPGAIAAWVGFTLPSALAMYACAVLFARIQGPVGLSAMQGFKLLAVAVVAQAVIVMAKRSCTALTGLSLAVAAAAVALALSGTVAQLASIALGAVVGALLCTPTTTMSIPEIPRSSPRVAWVALGLFAVLLAGLWLAAQRSPLGVAALAEVFYRAGALVFGGGHVVLPLLHDALVTSGGLSDADFIAGYGLAQVVPGPLFSVAAYFGAVSPLASSPAIGALVALLAIFVPGLLLAAAGTTLWGLLTTHPRAAGALAGVNAVVVGLLAAALVDPVWITAVRGVPDAAIAVAGLLMLHRWNLAPLAVLAWCVGASMAIR